MPAYTHQAFRERLPSVLSGGILNKSLSIFKVSLYDRYNIEEKTLLRSLAAHRATTVPCKMDREEKLPST
jgi:hypothetical protein